MPAATPIWMQASDLGGSTPYAPGEHAMTGPAAAKVGAPIHFTAGADVFDLATAASGGNKPCNGFIVSVLDAAANLYLVGASGFVTVDPALYGPFVAGGTYWLANGAGGFAAAPPAAFGEIQQILGEAPNTLDFNFNPESDFVGPLP